jgi:transcriptional regulator with XRE-family HTH domain
MDTLDYSAIGQRIKLLRKRKGLNQQELAQLLGKSLRTVQKYETGEIEVSIATVNQLADILESTPTYILGYEANTAPIRSLADIMGMLFQLEQVVGVTFDIDVQRPPRSADWKCAISFNGKAAGADFNTDLCLFLENWEQERDNIRSYYHSQEDYRKWKDKTLAYYAASSVTCVEPEDIEPKERMEKRLAYLHSLSEPKGEDKV